MQSVYHSYSVISQKKSNFEYWPLYIFSHEEFLSSPTIPKFITVHTSICPLNFCPAVSIHNVSYIFRRILERIYQILNPPTFHHFSLRASCLLFLIKMKWVPFMIQEFSTGQGANIITHSFFWFLHAVWHANLWHSSLLAVRSVWIARWDPRHTKLWYWTWSKASSIKFLHPRYLLFSNVTYR